MIKSREEILKINPVFTQHVLDIQDAKYNPRHDPLSAGDEITDEKGRTLILTKEQADELNREDYEDFLSLRDKNPMTDMPEINWEKTAVFEKAGGSTDDSIKAIIAVFKEISREFRQKTCIFLSDLPVFWMGMPGEFNISAETLGYFLDMADEQFMGGFQVKWNELDDFIPRLSELIMKNDDIQEICIGFESLHSIFSICRQAHLHVDHYEGAKEERITAVITKYLHPSAQTAE